MGQAVFLVECGKQNTADSSVKVSERVNPLKAPVGPGNYISGLLLLCP